MNTKQDFKQLQFNVDRLIVGETYFYLKRIWPKGFGHMAEEEFIPVKIVSNARQGEYGPRVVGDDGIARYSQGWELGRNRSDSHKPTDLKYSLVPGKRFYPKLNLTPHVQLDLFESLANP